MVPGITHSFVQNYMEQCLKNILEMQELTNIILYILLMHMRNNSPYDDINGVGTEIPLDSKTWALSWLGETFDLNDSWLKGFDQNYQDRPNMYIEDMKDLFNKIPVQLPKPLNHKEKRQ